MSLNAIQKNNVIQSLTTTNVREAVLHHLDFLDIIYGVTPKIEKDVEEFLEECKLELYKRMVGLK